MEPPKGLRLWSSAPELHGHQQIKCPWVLEDPRRLTRALTQPRCQASTREAEDSAMCCFERSLLTLPASLEPSISLASQTPGGATGREEACGRRLASAPACAMGGRGATAEFRDHPPMPPPANLQQGWVWWGQSGPSATVSPRALPPNRTDPTPCQSSPTWSKAGHVSILPRPLGGSQALLSLRIAGLRVGAWAQALLFCLARGLLSLLPGAPRHLLDSHQPAAGPQEGGRRTSAPCECTAVTASGWACLRPSAWCLATLPPGPAAWPCICSFPARAICAGTACQESLEGHSPVRWSARRSTGGGGCSVLHLPRLTGPIRVWGGVGGV